MKTRFTQKFLMAFLMMGLFTASQAQTYVNGAATGANDGSSWADAYSDLSAALEATTEGDVWVASGRYLPADAGLDTFNTFLVVSPLNIYGGFAGTESSIDERVGGNTTTLSGDFAGDDMDNALSTNKEDNVFHVVSVDVGATDVVILDGLTISGGAASFDRSSQDNYNYGGAGVWSSSTIEINNCDINNNTSGLGGAVLITGNGNDSKITNSTISRHFADFGGAVFIAGGSNFLFDNTTFVNNSCSTSGGVIYAQDVTDYTVSNSTFDSNSAQFAGTIINFDCTSTISNCSFLNNNAISLGGALLNQGGVSSIVDCLFERNVAVGNGGAFFSGGGVSTFTGCNFDKNETEIGGAGGAIWNQNAIETLEVNFSKFDGNFASTGGAIFTGFGSRLVLNNCTLEDNESEGDGGALTVQNDTTLVVINDTKFIENNTDGNGGAISVRSPITMTIARTYFNNNSSAGFGGAITAGIGTTEFDDAYMSIDNCIFTENSTGDQGAAISMVDYNSDINNSLFIGNISNNAGARGALSLNAGDTSTVNVNIAHTTIAANFGEIGSGIAAFTSELESKITVKLTNSILANADGDNYAEEAGSPKFQSDGGNISTDETTANAFTNTNDMNSVDYDVLFTDADELDFTLADGSPAIENGVEIAGLTTDINGNERVGSPDSGPYEANLATSTEEILENNGQLKMTPNPASTISVITVDNAWKGTVNMTVTDMTGKVVANQNVNKSAQTQDFNLNVSAFSEGNYIVTLRAEDEVVSTQFIKI